MKILQVVTQMEAGGAQKVAWLLHEGFRERGLSAELCFLYTKRPAYDGLDGVFSLLDHPPSALEYLKVFSRLHSLVRSAKPDVVITHTHYANIMGQIAATLAGTPKRIAVHHNPLPTYPQAARFLDRLLGQAGAYSKIIAVSDSVVDTLTRYPKNYKRRVSRIYNGLPPSFQASKTDQIRAILRIPPDSPLLVNVARLSRQKNHCTLLEALKRLPSVHLAILGDGELFEQLKAQAAHLGISDRVHFAGEVPREVVFSYLHTADAFVFPSLWESMGLAVVEAMQAGVPVIASDLPAMREVLGDSGVLVPPSDASALARAIEWVLRDGTVAETLRSRAYDRARFFSADAMIDGYQQSISA